MIVGDVSDSDEEYGSAGNQSFCKEANGETAFHCQLPRAGLFHGRHHTLSPAHADFPCLRVQEWLVSVVKKAVWSSSF